MDGLSYLVWHFGFGIRTHLNAAVRWIAAATSSKTGGILPDGPSRQSGNRALYRPPYRKHPSLFPVGSIFGFFVYSKILHTEPVPLRFCLAQNRCLVHSAEHARSVQSCISQRRNAYEKGGNPCGSLPKIWPCSRGTSIHITEK